MDIPKQQGDCCGRCGREFLWKHGLARCINCDFTLEQQIEFGWRDKPKAVTEPEVDFGD